MPQWEDAPEGVTVNSYTCGYCHVAVATPPRWVSRVRSGFGGRICICPRCKGPTYITSERQVPGLPFGAQVRNLPWDVQTLYDEARACIPAGAPTACVLSCRKLLMHIAVERGAKPNDTFKSYINYLANSGLIPSRNRAWVDEILAAGNEANHEIVLLTRKGAEEMMLFMEFLLRLVYELPVRATGSTATPAPST